MFLGTNLAAVKSRALWLAFFSLSIALCARRLWWCVVFGYLWRLRSVGAPGLFLSQEALARPSVGIPVILALQEKLDLFAG